MANDDPQLITIRRSTIVRAGVVVAGSRSSGCRNRHWIECRLREFSTEQFLCHRRFDHRATCSRRPPRPPMRPRQPWPLFLPCCPADRDRRRTCAPATLTVGMCNKDHHGDEYHVERLGSRDVVARVRAPLTVGAQSAPAIVVVFHVVAGIFQDVSVTPSKDVLIDTSDHYFDDSRDDPFVRSANDDDDDRWHCVGRGVTARIRMGRELSASPRSPAVARPRRVDGRLRSARAPEAGRVRGSAHSHRRIGNPRRRALPERRRLPRRSGTTGDHDSSEHCRSDGSRRRRSCRPWHRLRRWVGHQLPGPLDVRRQGCHRCLGGIGVITFQQPRERRHPRRRRPRRPR